MPAMLAALKDIWRLTIPYFTSNKIGEARIWGLGTVKVRESWVLLFMLATIVALELIFSYVAKLFNAWSNSFYNTLQEKDYQKFIDLLFGGNFWSELTGGDIGHVITAFTSAAPLHILLGSFLFLAFAHIFLSVIKNYINQLMQIRWRRSMSEDFVTRWMEPAQHYRLRFGGTPADNPDQRISEDVHNFVGTTMVLAIGFFGNAVRLGIFTMVLWTLSQTFPMQSFGFSYNIPGYLVWVSLAYALVGTLITHLIGRALVDIEFRSQRYEANFRFAMARLRENSEQIALLQGEGAEKVNLLDKYAHVYTITIVRIKKLKQLGWFVNFFGQFSVIFPFLMLGPAYFFGTAKLGDMMQTAQTFGHVQDGMTWFVDTYTSLASYRATVKRLTGFQQSMQDANSVLHRDPHITTLASPSAAFEARDVRVTLPDGKPITAAPAFNLRPGERVLLSGPSGSGKTTLLRAFSGIWPFGSGTVALPPGKSALVLPQRSYLPQGSLRAALAYPGTIGTYSDGDIHATLERVGLGQLSARLDDTDNWSGILSGGEQQRVALARAMLMKPDFLFLDEATSNLDEASEGALYQALITQLPGTAILSIAHRSSLVAYHTSAAHMEKDATGRFALAMGRVLA